MRANLRFDITTILYLVVLILVGANWLHIRLTIPYIMTPWPLASFFLIIILSPVIFPLIWAKAVYNGVIFPYLEIYRLKHPKPKRLDDARTQELEDRIYRLEERLESREDLMYLYRATLDRLLGKDKAEEEIDVQWQIWEASLN